MKNWKKVALAALILASSSAFGDEIATAVALRGAVFADDVPVNQGSVLSEGAAVMTADRSFVVLQFFDGARITIRPNSELVITRYRDDEVNLSLVEGGLRVVTGAIAKNNPENFTFNANTVLMGVRGTEFSVEIIGD